MLMLSSKNGSDGLCVGYGSDEVPPALSQFEAPDRRCCSDGGQVSVISQFDGLMIEFGDGSRCRVGSSGTFGRA
jgi:hypothetical protein